MSLQNGKFADNWKMALVLPILKKIRFELLFQNYRPVSNLRFMSKVAERTVFDQIRQHMMLNNLCPLLQSAHRQKSQQENSIIES